MEDAIRIIEGLDTSNSEEKEECIQYCGWCGQRLDWSDEQ